MADKKEKKGKTIAAEEWAAIHRTDVSSEVNQIMRGAYLQYSVSANIGRAIPDVRDGLKPGARRILYAMLRGGYTYSGGFNSPRRSSASSSATTIPMATRRSTTRSSA